MGKAWKRKRSGEGDQKGLIKKGEKKRKGGGLGERKEGKCIEWKGKKRVQERIHIKSSKFKQNVLEVKSRRERKG